jgi:hypothetical protein
VLRKMRLERVANPNLFEFATGNLPQHTSRDTPFTTEASPVSHGATHCPHLRLCPLLDRQLTARFTRFGGAEPVSAPRGFRRRRTEQTFFDHNTLSEQNQPLTHLTLPPRRTLWTGGQIRFGHHPKLALFRISCSAAGAVRFRGPGVPSRQSAHFGFVPSSCQGGQCSAPRPLAPGPRRGGGLFPARTHADPRRHPYPIEIEALTHRHPPGDASCQKTSPDASPDRVPPPQLTQK